MKNVGLCQRYCYNLSLNSVHKLIKSFNALFCLPKNPSIINSFCQGGHNDLKFSGVSYLAHQRDEHFIETLLSDMLR